MLYIDNSTEQIIYLFFWLVVFVFLTDIILNIIAGFFHEIFNINWRKKNENK